MGGTGQAGWDALHGTFTAGVGESLSMWITCKCQWTLGLLIPPLLFDNTMKYKSSNTKSSWSEVATVCSVNHYFAIALQTPPAAALFHAQCIKLWNCWVPRSSCKTCMWNRKTDKYTENRSSFSFTANCPPNTLSFSYMHCVTCCAKAIGDRQVWMHCLRFFCFSTSSPTGLPS